MAPSPGIRIGPYEIIGTLGAGGMGEVYRTRDTRLKRDVALKILPQSFADNSERLARFQREAEVLASLNHPNIAAIYGSEEQNGTRALVMELVEGPTLAERITEGPIPIDEALPIARQIAEALEAAHEHGIIHRDLKPANIKVRPDGTVKVLDFGLAKALEPATVGRADATASPTITSPAMMTGVGMLLGTAAYMSPEQARGKAVDKRADIWAFGCVLYEMLTGKRAFQGEDVSDTLASVLKATPDWSRLPSDLSPTIVRLLKHCLTKDRHLRPADIAAASFALGEPSGASQQSSIQRSFLWRWPLLLTTTGIVCAAVAAAGVWYIRPAAPLETTRLQLLLPKGQQFAAAAAGRRLVGISPDGSQIAYVAETGLFVQTLSEREGRQLVSSADQRGIQSPVFSPDGRWIAFYSVSDRAIKRVAVAGGAAATVDSTEAPNGLGWAEDSIVFATLREGVIRLDPTGHRETLLPADPGEVVLQPQLLPGGRALLFTVADLSGVLDFDRSIIAVQSLGGSERKILVEGGSDARYVATGHIIYSLGGVLWAIPFDLERLQVTGSPVSVVEGVARGFGGVGLATSQFSVADNGSLVYIPGPATVSSARRTLVSVDQNGTVEPLRLPPGAYLSPRVAPDGTKVALVSDDGKDVNIWIYDLIGTTSMRRLTLEGRNRFPTWSADSRRVVFQSDRGGDLGIWWQAADGSGAAERLTKAEGGAAHIPESWRPTTEAFSFSVMPSSGEVSLWTFSLRTRKAEPISTVRSTSPLDSAYSPDGHWLAYTLRTPGRSTINVEPAIPTGGKYEVAASGHHPLWSPDGARIVYFPGSERLIATHVVTHPAFGVSGVEAVAGGFTSNTSTLSGRNHDFTPDGHIVAVLTAAELSGGAPAAEHIEVILNWLDELKRLVPTN